MIIDINNKENLVLKSSRDTFLQSLIFINSIDKRNISNIYYELTRTTNIKDKDLNFVFHFLNIHNYLTIDGEFVLIKIITVEEPVPCVFAIRLKDIKVLGISWISR